ncbi:hypothetical protein [Saccharothrix obliqua]|uniref:hypothetical protein n=1 Tax=Saccharothrix obliqua TaxID=2861747 RepID=UPI001C5D6E2A|nr:hypothetical protein [Saccharothrix obliqua]MBW4721172.1 hypothetical protein [Saccharothrix obliqua]
MNSEVPLPGPPRDPVAGVEDALAALDGLEQLDVAEHVARFDAAHTALTAALAGIDKV